MAYLLEWFYEVKKSDEPISFAELDAWNRLTGKHASKDEIEAIMELDMTWAKVRIENTKKP